MYLESCDSRPVFTIPLTHGDNILGRQQIKYVSPHRGNLGISRQQICLTVNPDQTCLFKNTGTNTIGYIDKKNFDGNVHGVVFKRLDTGHSVVLKDGSLITFTGKFYVHKIVLNDAMETTDDMIDQMGHSFTSHLKRSRDDGDHPTKKIRRVMENLDKDNIESLKRTFTDISNSLIPKVDSYRAKNPPKLWDRWKVEDFDSEKKTVFLFHERCLDHRVPEFHLEKPERLEVILTSVNEFRAHFPNSGLVMMNDFEPIENRILLLAHDKEYIELMESKIPNAPDAIPRHATQMSLESQPRAEDLQDTFVSHESFNAARYAAGAVCKAIDLIFSNRFRNSFVAVRPPGHHAGRSGHTENVSSQGFCLINNVAIGALYAIEKYQMKKVLIFDFDIHHGNGTEDIVSDNDNILFVSIHSNDIYPYTGNESSKNIINMPINPGAQRKIYRDNFRIALQKVSEYQPDLILISAGFDAHKNDPCGAGSLDVSDYKLITEKLREVANKHSQSRIVSVLEGGYNLSKLGELVVVHLAELLKT